MRGKQKSVIHALILLFTNSRVLFLNKRAKKNDVLDLELLMKIPNWCLSL